MRNVKTDDNTPYIPYIHTSQLRLRQDRALAPVRIMKMNHDTCSFQHWAGEMIGSPLVTPRAPETRVVAGVSNAPFRRSGP